MKRIFRFSGLAVLAAAFVGFGATASIAQDQCADTDGQTALYTKFTELYPKTDLESRKALVDTGKQFLEKYGACEALKEQNEYLKKALPALEEAVKKIEEGQAMKALFGRFDAAVGQTPAASKPDEALSAGKEILAKQPDNLNVMVAMALVASNHSTAANNFKYADDGIRLASGALSKIKGGAKFTKKNDKGEEMVGAYWTDRTRPEAIAASLVRVELVSVSRARALQLGGWLHGDC